MAAAPFFIVGPGRSGTTLLRTLLAAHPRIAIPPETHFIGALVPRRGAPVPPDLDAQAAWDIYRRHPRFGDLGLDPDVVAKVVPSGGAGPQAAFAALLDAYRTGQGAARVGEKTPGHWRYVRQLLTWFPDARILAMQRDPRASGASQLRTPWVRDEFRAPSLQRGLFTGSRMARISRDATVWAEVARLAGGAWAGNPRIASVSYEALVGDPEGTLRRLTGFLGEAFDPRMLSDLARAETLPETLASSRPGWDDWQERHYAKTRGAVRAPETQAWRTELSAREIAVIEGICGPAMERMGYARSQPRRAGALGSLEGQAMSLAVRAERGLRRRLRRQSRGGT